MISDEEAKEIKKQLLQQIEKFPEDQRDAIKQKIESMDNEQLEQFVKQQTKQSCIFCEIVKGNVKSYKIYEDNKIIAMLDIMPATKGHIIIIPKQHVQFLTQLTDDEVKNIFLIARKIIPFITQITNCQGVDLYLAQGINQKVPHLTLNLIPRYQNDKINFDWQREKADEKELGELQKQISSQLDKIKQKEHQEKKEVKQEKEESEAQKMMKHIQERIP
jgi:histidine triad (HIT) family protein